MSSADSPPEATVDASPIPDDGGSSKHLTQGEIIFVTILSFLVVLAVSLAIYAIFFQNRKRQQQLDQEKANNAGGGQGTEIVVDIEANNGAMGQKANGAENNGREIQRSASSGAIPRRASEDSNGGGGRRPRRSTLDHTPRSSSIDRGPRRATTEGPVRRTTVTSMGTNVSSHYKLAAIEHMNQISQAGRL